MDKENITGSEQIKTLIFHYLIGFAGIALFIYSINDLQITSLDSNFLIVAAIAIGFGSKICLNIESLKTSISVVDVFVFLILLLFGSAAAVAVISVEAYITSFKYTKKFDVRLFNSGNLTISMFVSVKVSQLLFGDTPDLKTGITFPLVLTLLSVVLTYYFVNSALVSISNAFRMNRSAYSVWKEYYIWTVFGFLACGSVALIAANAIQTSGMFSFILILPIIGIIYFSYYSQQGKLQAITEKVEQSEKFLSEITESEERFRSAFINAPIGMALISTDGNWLQTNQSLCDIFGFESEEFTARKFGDFLHHQDLVNFNSNVGLLLQGKISSYQAEIRYINKAGDEIWTQTSVSPANDNDSPRLICQIQDITARQKAEAKLKHDAFYDSLTDLANRTMMMKKLDLAISKANRNKDCRFVALFIDLDRFKLVNDSNGHDVGDKLLIAFSERLRKCLPNDSELSRLGGDEFFVLIENNKFDLSQIEDLAIEIQSQISADFRILFREISITASIGIVYCEDIHKTAEDILRDAGTALHLAKNQGRAKHIIFDEKMREKAAGRMQLERDLQKAVERNELFLVYQPILSLDNKSLDGFEALVRWNNPTRGLIPPTEFIPLAEESGLISQIGQFVLDESCRQLKVWQDEFSMELPITISVNVSAKQLLQKNLFANVIDTLETHKIKSRQIKLEITESVVVENTEMVISILRQFHSIGIKLSMDDFGTGYSSLSYLHQLPISTLKIDRSFISKITDKADTAEIIKTILLLAKNLNLNVVAEGIETPIQLEVLKTLHCDLGQGYYFAKPLSVTDAAEFIKESTTRYNFIGVDNPDNQIQPTIH
jgi:diguanylate cyclase (GGDEF)-like protein/PAS domain S-box-containing protein